MRGVRGGDDFARAAAVGRQRPQVVLGHRVADAEGEQANGRRVLRGQVHQTRVVAGHLC